MEYLDSAMDWAYQQASLLTAEIDRMERMYKRAWLAQQERFTEIWRWRIVTLVNLRGMYLEFALMKQKKMEQLVLDQEHH